MTFELFCLDIAQKYIYTAILHKIDSFPSKIIFFINVKNYYVEICFVSFFC